MTHASFPFKAAAVLLAGFVLIVPVLIWNGTATVIDTKLFLMRTIILAASALLIADFLIKKTIPVPKPISVALGLALIGYTCVICFLRPYTDWEIFGDLCLSVLLFLEASVLLRNGRSTRRVLVAWQISAAAVSAYFIVQQAGLDIVYWPTQTVGSTFSNRNLMAYFLVCSFPYGLYLFMEEKGWVKWLAALSSALTAAAFLVSTSRVSFVILLLSVPAYLFFLRSRGKQPLFRKLMLIAGVAAIIGIFICLVAAVVHLFGMPANDLNGLSHGRLALWKETLQFIKNDAWFGHGAGAFATTSPAYRSQELGYWFGFYAPVLNSHNEFLEILAEYGIIGLGLFSALVIRASGLVPVVRKGPVENKNLLFFSCMSLAGCLVFAFVGEAPHMFVCAAFSWLSLAVCGACAVPAVRTFTMSNTFFRFFAIACALWCAATAWSGHYYSRLFNANIYTKRATIKMGAPETQALAQNDLEAALRVVPENKYALYQRAYIATAQGRYQDALRDYEEIRRTDPYFENLHYNAGVVNFRMGDYAKAAENLMVTTHLYPTFAPARLPLIESLYYSGRFKECLVWCDWLQTMDPENEKTKLVRRLALKRLGEAQAP